MAEALASWANPLLSVRIGWELNGNWYKWSNGVGTNATYGNFVSAFKRAAGLVRKHNPHVLVQWNLAWGQPDPTPYWPGAYDATSNPGGVDVVSMDFYQANISQYNNGGKQSSWALAQSGVTIDLDWMVAFAQQHGVKIRAQRVRRGKPIEQRRRKRGRTRRRRVDRSVDRVDELPAARFLSVDRMERRCAGR